MLCIRISEQEYEGLRSVCDARGARSISDLAREAVSRLIDSPKNTPDWLPRVEEIDGKVEALKRELTRLQGVHELTAGSSITQGDLLALKAQTAPD